MLPLPRQRAQSKGRSVEVAFLSIMNRVFANKSLFQHSAQTEAASRLQVVCAGAAMAIVYYLHLVLLMERGVATS